MPHIDIYGVDHSPWVQAVLLGLHDKKVPHTLSTVAPFSVFRNSGVMMPAASIDGEPWQLESSEILQRVGYAPISASDRRAINVAWQGVLHRPNNAFAFIHGFSVVSDPHTSMFARLRNHFLRSFTSLYMFLLINSLTLLGKRPDPEDFADQFLHWQRELEETSGDFLGGAEPDMRDLMLFGVIQCHCSIPVPPLTSLREDPRLAPMRSWIGTMHDRFSGYDHLYSGQYFDPRAPAPAQSTGIEQMTFWLGFVSMLMLFPITLSLILYFAMTARRSAPSD